MNKNDFVSENKKNKNPKILVYTELGLGSTQRYDLLLCYEPEDIIFRQLKLNQAKPKNTWNQS